MSIHLQTKCVYTFVYLHDSVIGCLLITYNAIVIYSYLFNASSIIEQKSIPVD